MIFEDFGLHWPFMAAALIIAVVMQALKRVVPNTPKAQRWFRPLVPVLPVVFGAAFGFIAGIPMPIENSTLAGIVLYYALSGVASTWAFSVVKRLLAVRGVDIETLRPSTRPGPPPPSPFPEAKP